MDSIDIRSNNYALEKATLHCNDYNPPEESDDTDTSTDSEKPADTENTSDSDAPTNNVLGDPDGDGEITMLDVTTMQRFIARLILSFE